MSPGGVTGGSFRVNRESAARVGLTIARQLERELRQTLRKHVNEAPALLRPLRLRRVLVAVAGVANPEWAFNHTLSLRPAPAQGLEILNMICLVSANFPLALPDFSTDYDATSAVAGMKGVNARTHPLSTLGKECRAIDNNVLVLAPSIPCVGTYWMCVT